jgi:hypothetical protein
MVDSRESSVCRDARKGKPPVFSHGKKTKIWDGIKWKEISIILKIIWLHISKLARVFVHYPYAVYA